MRNGIGTHDARSLGEHRIQQPDERCDPIHQLHDPISPISALGVFHPQFSIGSPRTVQDRA